MDDSLILGVCSTLINPKFKIENPKCVCPPRFTVALILLLSFPAYVYATPSLPSPLPQRGEGGNLLSMTVLPSPRWGRGEGGEGVPRNFGAGGEARVRQAPKTPVILISIDTLRADHLSSFGYRHLHTAHIDSLTQGGTVFLRASSLVPLTFPSHASLLTSTYPFATGIEDNGEDLPSRAVTLATVLKARGYRTAAFVASFILDRRFGLNQGFDFYDSPFDLHRHPGIDPGDLKRLGSDVEAAAARWIAENAGTPFFVFVHFYDLHTPYDPPPAYKKRYPRSGYDGEIAYVDDVLGRFEAFLRDRGLYQKSLIVLTADHGEGLGEHGESTHGYFIYQSTIHVPLIFHWPEDRSHFSKRIQEPVSLIDVAPTILQFLGLPLPRQFQGHSLLSEIQNGLAEDASPVYSESLYGYKHFGTAPLRSLHAGSYQFIAAPKPELYDLNRDPTEVDNTYGQHRAVAASLGEQINGLISRYRRQTVPHRVLSPEAVSLLQSLPYVASGDNISRRPESGADPKDRIVQFEAYGRALILASHGRLSESSSMLRNLLSKYPGLTDVRLALGLNLQKAGRHRDAIQEFRRVLSTDPTNVLAHFDMAVSYYALGQFPQAIQEARATLALAPYYTRADSLLGTVWIQEKHYDRAQTSFKHALAYAPSDYTANYNLGVLAALSQDWDVARRYLSVAVQTEPGSPEGHNALGSIYLRQGDLRKAGAEFTEAVRLQPRFAWAHYNLGLVFRAENATDKAKEEFRRALEDDPRFGPAREALQQE
jgi:choline-sulfatase